MAERQPGNVTIEVAHPEILRDYFLQLGADAWVSGGGTIRVEAPESWGDEVSVSDCVRRWSSTNGVPARVA
jgi:hypothetical protein